jgi:hypothetical protein
MYWMIRSWQVRNNDGFADCRACQALTAARLAWSKGYQTMYQIISDADFEGILW